MRDMNAIWRKYWKMNHSNGRGLFSKSEAEQMLNMVSVRLGVNEVPDPETVLTAIDVASACGYYCGYQAGRRKEREVSAKRSGRREAGK